MPQDYTDLESLKKLGEFFGFPIRKNETEAEYRERLALFVENEHGDSVWAQEIRIGKGWDKWDQSQNLDSLGTFIRNNQRKKELLRLNNDTYYGISWTGFQNVALSLGFEEVLSESILADDRTNYGRKINEELKIWAHLPRGLLLVAESSRGDSVNSSYLHGEVVVPKTDRKSLDNFPLFSGGLFEKGGYVGIYFKNDAREGLKSYLKRIESGGYKFNVPWSVPEKHFLYFVAYAEKSMGYKQATAQRVEKLPENVREMIGFQKHK